MLNLTGGGLSGGYYKYLLNILPRLAKNSEIEALLCIYPYTLSMPTWFKSLDNVEFIGCKPFGLINYHLQRDIKQHLKMFSPDVIFIPMERYIKFEDIPVVNMVRNMLPLVSTNSNPIHETLRNYILKKIARGAVDRSTRVIAVSNYVKDYLQKMWGIPEERIGLVYHGVNLDNVYPEIKPNFIPEKLDKKLLFTAGSIDPFRGLEDILSSLQILKKQGIETTIIIAGKAKKSMLSYEMKLRNIVKNNKLSLNVYWAGHLDEKEMAWCYKNCYAFVMTSRVEACPNVALEALSFGCLSVVANNPPLPELFGNSTIYYIPNDPNSLAESIKKLLNLNKEERTSISEEAKKRASIFSWDITEIKTVKELLSASKNAKCITGMFP